MKLNKLTIISAFTALALNANAWDFEANVSSDQYNALYWKFEWVEKDKTCKIVSEGNLYLEKVIEEDSDNHGDVAYKPTQEKHIKNCKWVLKSKNNNTQSVNQIGWQVQNGLPSTVNYNGKTITIVEIGDFAFANTANIQNITIPETVTKIGKGAFYGWNQWGNLNLGNVQYIGEAAFCGSRITNLKLPQTIVEVDPGAFSDNSAIQTINAEDFGTLEIIPEGMFAGCTQLKNLSLSNYVTSVGDFAFSLCNVLENLTLGENITSIGNYAFAECRTMKSVKIPDSVITIGDGAFCHCIQNCPIQLGKNVEEIGDYAFYYANQKCTSTIEFPASLRKIGYMAFNFNKTGGTQGALSDIYCYSPVPPELDKDDVGHYAFGIYDESMCTYPNASAFYSYQDLWMYPYMCLHVPVGTYDLYKSVPGWKEFSCIIDDLVVEEPKARTPEPVNPLDYIIGYAYMVPGETVDIVNDVLQLTDEQKKTLNISGWQDTDNQKYVTLTQDGKATATDFGNRVVYAYRTGQYTQDASGAVTQQPDALVGAVILFVCPTYTLVYDNIDPNAPKKLGAVKTNDAEGEINEVDELKDSHATYQHRVVYNSYPKLQLESVSGIEIETIQRAKIDVENNYTDDGSLQPIDEENQLLQEDSGTYVVPKNPVVEDRVLVVSQYLTTQNTTSVKEIEVSDNIKVRVVGYNVTIEGADPAAIVTATNMNGQTVYEAADKTFTLDTPGVYLIHVDDVTFKAMVH